MNPILSATSAKRLAGALALTAIFLGGAAAAESPVVQSVRSAVDALEARSKRLRPTRRQKEVPGAFLKLTLWKEKGRLVRATLDNYGDAGGSETDSYWKDGAPVFVFWKFWAEDGANSPTGPTRFRVEERRLYYQNGKAAMVRIGKAEARGKVRPITVQSRDISPKDPRWKEALDAIRDDLISARKGNLDNVADE